jgi:RimJ/RimL family protein N-acetyltransferase
VAVLLSDDVVVLRPLTPDDADEWLTVQDGEEIHWFEFARPASRGDVEKALAVWAESWVPEGPAQRWAISPHDTGGIVGGVELRGHGDGVVTLSYVVFPGWRRRGIATRACRLALAHAAAVGGCRAAMINVPLGSAASAAVARKLGAIASGMEVTAAGDISTVLRVDLESHR